MDIRKEVKWFSEQMEAKLKKNDHKSGWINGNKCVDPNWLLQRLRDEVTEIERKLNPSCPCRESGCNCSNRPVKDLVISECADVANFAMMIADIARKFL